LAPSFSSALQNLREGAHYPTTGKEYLTGVIGDVLVKALPRRVRELPRLFGQEVESVISILRACSDVFVEARYGVRIFLRR